MYPGNDRPVAATDLTDRSSQKAGDDTNEWAARPAWERRLPSANGMDGTTK
jgi:hypothetical protein